MGLDVYAGTLTRYFRRDWETVVQRWGRRHGIPIPANGAGPGPGLPADEITVRGMVTGWRNQLAEAIAEHLERPLWWDEEGLGEYATDTPGWDGFAGLLLLSAYAEQPRFRPPVTVPENWANDPAWLASEALDAHSRYTQLHGGTEWWLPYDGAFTFVTPGLKGRPVCVGSVAQLRRELRLLNDSSFRLDRAARAEARREGAESGATFHVTARFGLALMLDLVDFAAGRKLPLLLDY